MILALCWCGAFKCVLTQCQGGKTSAMIFEKQLSHQSEKAFKAISKQFEVHHSMEKKIIYEWKTSSQSFP